jgi:hypothetical protein
VRLLDLSMLDLSMLDLSMIDAGTTRAIVLEEQENPREEYRSPARLEVRNQKVNLAPNSTERAS